MTVAKVLNIEVGDRVTKICVSEKNKKGYQISNSFLMQTPIGSVRDGQITVVPGRAGTVNDTGVFDQKIVHTDLLTSCAAAFCPADVRHGRCR